MAEVSNPELQREVQRLIGRCLLRLQQYEKQLKSLLAQHEVAGPADELQAGLAARVEGLRTNTLGTLVKAFLGSYVEVGGTERTVEDDDRVSPQTMTIRFRAGMQMSEDQFSETRSALQDLVGLRNDLVHHLIDRFDLWSDSGCCAAIEHLNNSYARIDAHFEELHRWARSIADAAALHASFMQSEVFEDFVFNGIEPDGTITWPDAGIVRVLRAAIEALSEGGWARLDDAVAWIGVNHQEQVPAKYGCKSWPDVLDKARAFQFEYRGDPGGRKVGWYRERR